MAGWGTGSFENEDAEKFLADLHLKSPDELKEILAHAADGDDYLPAPESSVVVVVGEMVAAAKGAPAANLPGAIAEWMSKVDGVPSSEMSELARRAVNKVRLTSELKDLWHQAEGLNEWSAGLRDLEARLGA